MSIYQPDPLGKAIHEYHFQRKDGPVRVWIDDKEEPLLHPSTFFNPPEHLNELEKAALDLCRGEILDIGAGAGRHSLILQSRGFQVSALEISPLCCAVMKNRGINHVIESDIMKFSGEKFDTLLLLMNGFGLAGTEDGLSHFIKHLKTLLKPGGKIIGESSDILYMRDPANGKREIDLSRGYYGEVRFKLKFKDESAEFPWIYSDEYLLEAIATEIGFGFEILDRGPDYNYLCQLTT